MHPDGLREATRKALERQGQQQRTRLSPGEKSNRKRMATVVSVYEVSPYPRTPEPILAPEPGSEACRPKVENKRTWARGEADQGAVVEQGFAEALRRDPEQRMRWVVLTDGQEDLARARSMRRPGATRSRSPWCRISSTCSNTWGRPPMRLAPARPRGTRELGEGAGQRRARRPGPGRGGRSAPCRHAQAA